MKIVRTMVLNRSDLTVNHTNEKIENIKYDMFTYVSNGLLFYEDVSVFIDNNGKIRIINDPLELFEPKKL